MTKKDLLAAVQTYNEYKEILKEAEAEMAKAEAALKKEMEKKGVDSLDVGDFKVRWTPVISSRFDSKGFKAAEPDLYKEWTKEVESRRFSVA